MNVFFKKFFGITLILVAMIGMIISLFGAIGIWTVRSSVLVAVDETTELLITTLGTTSDGLIIVDESLYAATGTLQSTAQTTETMAQTLVDISTLANGIIGIVNMVGGGIDAPNTQNDILADDVRMMTDNLNQVTANLVEAREVVDNYQDTVDKATTQLVKIKQNGPTWITIGTILTTIVFVWLGIAQIGLLLQGIDLVR